MAASKKALKKKPARKASTSRKKPAEVPMLRCPVTGACIPADQAAAHGH